MPSETSYSAAEVELRHLDRMRRRASVGIRGVDGAVIIEAEHDVAAVIGRVEMHAVPTRREEDVELDLPTRSTVGDASLAGGQPDVALAVARPVRVGKRPARDHPEVAGNGTVVP